LDWKVVGCASAPKGRKVLFQVGVDQLVYPLGTVRVPEKVFALIQQFDLGWKVVSDQFPGCP
jgi:hypothetical protein